MPSLVFAAQNEFSLSFFQRFAEPKLPLTVTIIHYKLTKSRLQPDVIFCITFTLFLRVRTYLLLCQALRVRRMQRDTRKVEVRRGWLRWNLCHPLPLLRWNSLCRIYSSGQTEIMSEIVKRLLRSNLVMDFKLIGPCVHLRCIHRHLHCTGLC